MIKGRAFIQDGLVYIYYEGQDEEELERMKKSVKELGQEHLTLVEDSRNSFKVTIDKEDKETTKKIIDLAGYKEKIRSRTRVEKDLYDYLELKWP